MQSPMSPESCQPSPSTTSWFGKVVRVLLVTVAVLTLLAVVALISCLGLVDHRPYFREPYYAETIARLRAREATNTVAQGQLAAGFGRARLTPTVHASADDPAKGQFRSLPLAGYGDRHGRPATGAHDDLFVKAVALRVGDHLGVMLGADALIIPREVTDLAAERLGRELHLTREQLYLSATHTHSSLGGWGEGKVGESFAGPFQPGARLWFADRIVVAISNAVADLRPAAFGVGSFPAPQFVRNRLVGELGKVDPEFSFMVFKQEGGNVAVLGSYAAHATVLSGRNMEYSADYPGYWQRAVERATGGMAVFLAGGVGSHGPNAGAPDFDGAERMGSALATRLLEQLPQTPLTNFVAFSTIGVEVALPAFNVRITDGVRLRPWVAAKLLPAGRRSFLQAFRVGPTVWASAPCDFSGELAMGIKDLLRGRGMRGVVTSFNGDYVGYVIPHRYYHLNGYEPRLMSFYGPYVPDYFDELIRDMAVDLADASAGQRLK